MSVTLRCTTGTINYTDWLHVTAAKVLSPGAVVWETWIDVPITNYNFIIPGLDPENYIISFYDAPTNIALGTLRLQLIANALTNEFIYERRFYKCGRGGTGDPAPGDTKIIDPYFTGKTITGGFQEAFRFLEPASEWQLETTSTTDDTFAILTGHQFDTDEVFTIDIKLSAGVNASTGGSIYTGRVDVADAVYTALAGDKNKRHRLVGTIATQVITLPSLVAMNEDNMFLFDNGCGGVSRQVKIVCDGTDVIKYLGFKGTITANTTTFAEFWVDRGHILAIAKVDDNWEVIMPYLGANVGERFMGTFNDHPNTIIEDGQIGLNALDGDELPKLYWWVRNICPANSKISDATVDSPAYVHPAGKEGFFVVHPDPDNKKFRTGNWQNMSERGLKNFKTYGTDPERGTAGANDYPGGLQPQKLMNHRHFTINIHSSTSQTGIAPLSVINYQNEEGAAGQFRYQMRGTMEEATIGKSGNPVNDAGVAVGSTKNIVDNLGCVSLRRI